MSLAPKSHTTWEQGQRLNCTCSQCPRYQPRLNLTAPKRSVSSTGGPKDSQQTHKAVLVGEGTQMVAEWLFLLAWHIKYVLPQGLGGHQAAIQLHYTSLSVPATTFTGIHHPGHNLTTVSTRWRCMRHQVTGRWMANK